LIAEGEAVDQRVRENRAEREVGGLQMILGEIAFGQVAGSAGLIVLAVIGLRAVADVGGFGGR